MNGVWLAGLMNSQPNTITITTIDSFVMTIRLFTSADSRAPRISSPDSSARMRMAGMFMIPWTPSAISNGEWRHWYGTSRPREPRTRFKDSLHAMATVAAPIAYSRIRSHPMIHATNSPIVAYEYVYALPAIGIIDANSA